MAQLSHSVAQAIADAVKKIVEPKERRDSTVGTVTKVDSSGLARVLFDDGSTETPCLRGGVAVKAGDRVEVKVAEGDGTITANLTSPASGDECAEEALGIARGAGEDAAAASEHMAKAKAAAESATKSATDALRQLSTVENVVGTLNWITEHGKMEAVDAESFDPRGVYFTRSDEGKYQIGGLRYAIVPKPRLEDAGSYLALKVDESVQNYVMSHLAVTDEGLWIIGDESTCRILMSPGGTGDYSKAGLYVVSDAGGVPAFFGEELDFHAANGFRVRINANGFHVDNELGAGMFSIANYDNSVICSVGTEIVFSGSVSFNYRVDLGNAAFASALDHAQINALLPHSDAVPLQIGTALFSSGHASVVRRGVTAQLTISSKTYDHASQADPSEWLPIVTLDEKFRPTIEAFSANGGLKVDEFGRLQVKRGRLNGGDLDATITYLTAV